MNDRLKFRYWSKKSKCWFQSLILETDTGIPCWQDGSDLEDDILNEIVVEQCTGLKDKNGKLVFENDVVKTSFGDFVIKYCEKCKQFQLFYDECFACSGDVHWCEFIEELENNSVEVIGNIHENPELLGGK